MNEDPITRHAIVFLCLFNGLRIPSTRRLSRKPKTICFQPLISFDPSLYAPESMSALIDAYKRLNCSCLSLVDPPIEKATELILKYDSRPMNERLIIHYFGQGVMPPNPGGILYFFSNNHSNYKQMRLPTLLGKKSPVLLILDCDNAGCIFHVLDSYTKSKNQDVIAFMACSSDELLPTPSTIPYDILSSSILFPIEMALWFYKMHPSFTTTFSPIDLSPLEPFLFSIIDTIALSKFSTYDYYRLFLEDPTVANITRGYILACRILSHYSIHPCSLPPLPFTADCEIWRYWDLALDYIYTNYSSNQNISLLPSVFSEIETLFCYFPSLDYIPLLSYFFSKPIYEERVARLILTFIDNHPNAEDIFLYDKYQSQGDISKLDDETNFKIEHGNIIRELLLNIFLGSKAPNIDHFLIIAKVLALSSDIELNFDNLTLLYQNSPIAAQNACILAICCAVEASVQPPPSFLISFAVNATRKNNKNSFSPLLFGLVVSKTSAYIPNPENTQVFLDGLNSSSDEMKITCAFALGNAHDPTVISSLADALIGQNPMVTCEILFAISLAIRYDPKKYKIEDHIIQKLKTNLMKISNEDHNQDVQDVFKQLESSFEKYFLINETSSPINDLIIPKPKAVTNRFKSSSPAIKVIPKSRLPQIFKASLKLPNLAQRFMDGAFFSF